MRIVSSACIVFLFQLFPLFINVVYSSGEQHNRMESSCSAVAAIEDHTSYFHFQSVTNTTWTWYRPTTKDNRLEYSWTISLRDSDSPIYDFGAYLFKFPGSTQQEGTLEALLTKSQLSVFDRSGKLKNGLEIKAKVDDGGVVIIVDDPKTFNALLQSKPPCAFFRIRLPYKDPILCEAKIEYH